MNNLDDCYKRLGVAIVEQACKDAIVYKKEVKNFFCDENSLFALCMPNTDGEALLKRVYENFEKYGNYIPPDPNGAKAKRSIIITDSYSADSYNDYENDIEYEEDIA